jgi:hypothetical protein
LQDHRRINEKEKDEALQGIVRGKLKNDPLRIPVDQLKEDLGKKLPAEKGTISRGTARY